MKKLKIEIDFAIPNFEEVCDKAMEEINAFTKLYRKERAIFLSEYFANINLVSFRDTTDNKVYTGCIGKREEYNAEVKVFKQTLYDSAYFGRYSVPWENLRLPTKKEKIAITLEKMSKDLSTLRFYTEYSDSKAYKRNNKLFAKSVKKNQENIF